MAEKGAAYLRGIFWHLPLRRLENAAAYIKGWKENLQENKDWIYWASIHVKKVVEYIIDAEFRRQFEEKHLRTLKSINRKKEKSKKKM